MRSVIAAGHELTAQAAEMVLREGGNAFDAIVAAHFAACAAEPVLTSLGGGGFLLARPAGARPMVFDFFVQTPRHKRPPESLDLQPVALDFGTAKQIFHIGQGAIATPGSVKGMFEIHRRLCSMPMRELCVPAVEYAREGVRMNALSAYIAGIVHPIYTATKAARAIFGGSGPDGRLAEGDMIRQAEMADTLDALAIEGEDLFYRGEIAKLIARDCELHGGQIKREDLERYEVVLREPLVVRYRDATVMTNPPPSSGGILIAFALELLEHSDPGSYSFGSVEHLRWLAEAMALTGQARVDTLRTDGYLDAERLLDPKYLNFYRRQIKGRASVSRGTTHISVIDAVGNAASLSVSNGEGCGAIVPGTGIMLNNMLGEDDLSPHGLHGWPVGSRMSSMMSPSLVLRPDELIATGSGGSNRIRTAILQVLVNLIDFRMDVETAVCSPRIHLEDDRLSIEGGHDIERLKPLLTDFPEHKIWPALNLFFGGAHTVGHAGRDAQGAGDPRRGGVSRVFA